MKNKGILSAVLACIMLCSCGKTEVLPNTITSLPAEYSAEEPLMCSAESREEAEAIAEQYDITLVNFSHGVATFYTEEKPVEVIQRGIEKGWPELSLNLIKKLD